MTSRHKLYGAHASVVENMNTRSSEGQGIRKLMGVVAEFRK
jgi:hypothetical protein